MTDEQFRYIHRQLRTICIYLGIIFVVCLVTLCRADEPEVIDHGYTINDVFKVNKGTPRLNFQRNNHYILMIETTGKKNMFDVDKDKVKMSCPEGYRIDIVTIKETRQNVEDRLCAPTDRSQYKACDPDLFDYFRERTTGAELKCVKDK